MSANANFPLPEETTVTLRGCSVEEWNAKRGVRYLNLWVQEPYPHRVHVDVSLPDDRHDDDELNEALWPRTRETFDVTCRLIDGDLRATPDDFAPHAL